MNKHLMIDLETLDTRADAKVLSIGAVLFTAEGAVLNTFYRVLNLDQQDNRRMSHDTLVWWLKQSEAAREAFTAPNVVAHNVFNTLNALNQMISGHKSLKVWSNGAGFDIPIMEHLYAEHGLTPAWDFWNFRCFRTVRAMHRDVEDAPREGTYHNALDDAKYQAYHLIAIHRAKGGIL